MDISDEMRGARSLDIDESRPDVIGTQAVYPRDLAGAAGDKAGGGK